tara:strand:+ start:322 stop:810 length:489 start_codon:yes stop_codon:yes gene_type:complete
MTRAVTIAELGDQNVFTVDGTNDRVGIGSTQPNVKLDVGGVVVATAFTGDGSGLTGVANTANILSNSIIVAGITTVNASGVNVTGVITATTLNATTVSVAGTITYNDVANVDSVGVVTARSGIRVGAGQSISAVSGTLTYYGDGSNLTGAWEVRDTWLYGGG